MTWFTKVFSKKGSEADAKESAAAEKSDDKALSADEADEVLPDDNRSLVTQLIASNGLKMGMDLSKVVLPTFILEPRSLLEKLGDTVIHPEIFAALGDAETPELRMQAVMRWYLSAYHVRPRGTKKPFNPVLGETFNAKYTAAAASGDAAAATVEWTAQQVSHHPPVSAFFARSASGSVAMQGTFAPKSKFLGNSAASMGGGGFRILLADHGEVYYVSWPNVYVRGLLFGALLMEIGGPVIIRCPKTDMACELEFVTKGYFSGSYHQVKATCATACGASSPTSSSAAKVFTIDGSWTTKTSVTAGGGEAEVLFDTTASPVGTVEEVPMDEEKELAKGETQRMWSSRAVWRDCAECIAAKDQEGATAAKTKQEDLQRKLRADRAAAEEQYTPSLFTLNEAQGEWCFTGANAVAFPDVEL